MTVGSACALGAQERPVVWAGAALANGPIAPGSTVRLQLTARINEGWHLYSLTQGPGGPIPTRLTVDPGQPFTMTAPPEEPHPDDRFDPNFGLQVETYDKHVTFVVPIRVATTARAGVDTVAVTARYQTCNASLCLPPRTEHVAIPVTISGSDAHKAHHASG
jgi:thiol:disulfide interchange protein DsbD